MKKKPLPPVLGKDLMSSILSKRKDRIEGYAYKLLDNHFGMDTIFPETMDLDESTMSVIIPFADGKRRDGVGDLLEVGGIRTERHRSNPIFLFDHGKNVQLPIALTEEPLTKKYTVEIDTVNRQARAKAFFYQGKGGWEGIDREKDSAHALFCEQLFDLIVKGYIRAGSIGYQVIHAKQLMPDYERGIPAGLHLLSTLMLECSAVVLPANGDTVRKALCLPHVCGKPLSPILIKSLEPYAGEVKTQMGYEKSANPKPHSHQEEKKVLEGQDEKDFAEEEETKGKITEIGAAHRAHQRRKFEIEQSVIRHPPPIPKVIYTGRGFRQKPPSKGKNIVEQTIYVKSKDSEKILKLVGEYGIKLIDLGIEGDANKLQLIGDVKSIDMIAHDHGELLLKAAKPTKIRADRTFFAYKEPNKPATHVPTEGRTIGGRRYPSSEERQFRDISYPIRTQLKKDKKNMNEQGKDLTPEKEEGTRIGSTVFPSARGNVRTGVHSARTQLKKPDKKPTQLRKDMSDQIFVKNEDIEEVVKLAGEYGIKLIDLGVDGDGNQFQLTGDSKSIDLFFEKAVPTRIRREEEYFHVGDQIGEEGERRRYVPPEISPGRKPTKFRRGSSSEPRALPRGLSMSSTGLGKISRPKQKAMPKEEVDGEDLPPEEEAIPDEIQDDVQQDEAPPDEKLGAQILRCVHEDHRILLEEYHEMSQLLENDSVRQHLELLLDGVENVLDATEEMFAHEYSELEGLEGAMEQGDNPEGEDEYEEASPEGEDEYEEASLGEDEYENKEEGEEEEMEGEIGEEEEEETASSEEREEPTPEEAYEGTQKNGAKKRGKALKPDEISSRRRRTQIIPGVNELLATGGYHGATEGQAQPRKPMVMHGGRPGYVGRPIRSRRGRTQFVPGGSRTLTTRDVGLSKSICPHCKEETVRSKCKTKNFCMNCWADVKAIELSSPYSARGRATQLFATTAPGQVAAQEVGHYKLTRQRKFPRSPHRGFQHATSPVQAPKTTLRDNPASKFPMRSKILESHEYSIIEEAHSFLKDLSEMPTEQFGDQQRHLAFHFGKTFAGMAGEKIAPLLAAAIPAIAGAATTAIMTPKEEKDVDGKKDKMAGKPTQLRVGSREPPLEELDELARQTEIGRGIGSAPGDDYFVRKRERRAEAYRQRAEAGRVGVGKKDLSLGEEVAGDEMTSQRSLISEAGKFFHSLSSERAFGEAHREQCKAWHHSLKPLSKEEEMEEEKDEKVATTLRGPTREERKPGFHGHLNIPEMGAVRERISTGKRPGPGARAMRYPKHGETHYQPRKGLENGDSLPSEQTDMTPEKAKKILKDKWGELTPSQRGLFGAIAGKDKKDLENGEDKSLKDIFLSQKDQMEELNKQLELVASKVS